MSTERATPDLSETYKRRIIEDYPEMVRVIGEERAKIELGFVIGEIINRGIFRPEDGEEIYATI